MISIKFEVSKIVIFSAILSIGIGGTVQGAWRTTWELGASLEYSDNGSRSNSNEDDSVTLEPRGSIYAEHLGPNFDAEIGTTNSYRSRLSGDTGSSNNFDLDGSLNWKISPGLFEWGFENHFSSEFPIDIRSEPNESNNQDINSFSTSPSFTPRIFNNTNLIIEGVYIRTDAEETDIDNDRLQGRVGIQRQLTPSSSVSLNYEYEDTDYDDASLDPLVGNVDFDRDTYYIEYTVERPSLMVTAQLGYTEIERNEGENRESEGGDNTLSVNYTLNSTSSLVLTAYDTFTDTTNNAGQSSLGGGFGRVGNTGSTGVISGTQLGDIAFDVTGDTVDTKGFLVGYDKQFSRLNTSFQYFVSEDDHDLVQVNDRDTNGVVIEFGLPVTSTMLFSLLGEYRTTDFDIGDREDDDMLIVLSGEYYARENFRLDSSIEYRDRDSTIAGEDFDELQFRVGFSYTNF